MNIAAPRPPAPPAAPACRASRQAPTPPIDRGEHRQRGDAFARLLRDKSAARDDDAGIGTDREPDIDTDTDAGPGRPRRRGGKSGSAGLAALLPPPGFRLADAAAAAGADGRARGLGARLRCAGSRHTAGRDPPRWARH